MVYYRPYAKYAAGGLMLMAPPRSTRPQYRSQQSYTKVASKPRYRRGTRSSFKTKMLASTPAKHYMTNDNQTAVVGALHNTLYTCNLTSAIVTGSADNQRIGDAVQLLSLKLNGLLSSNAATNQACQFRLIIGWSGEEFSLPNTFASGLGNTQVFQAGTGTAWQNTAIVNPKAFTVIDDRVITLNNSITGVADVQEIAYTVPCNTAFFYQSAASTLGKTRNLYAVFIACTLNGVTGVTNAGSIALSTDLIFKQL